MLRAVRNKSGRAPSLPVPGPRKGSSHAGFTKFFLLFCLFPGFVTTAAAAPPAAQGGPASTPTSFSNFALADFDGDRKPDLASVEFNRFDSAWVRYSITFRLTAGGGQTVGVTAPLGGLELAARDVNGDASLDLIVRTAWLHQLVAVFLNDGHGHFAAADPSAFVLRLRDSCAALLSAVDLTFDNSALGPQGSFAWLAEGSSGLSDPRALWRCACSPGFQISLLLFSSSLGRAPPTIASLV